MHPKMVIGFTGFGKGLLQSPFLKQSNFSERKIIQKTVPHPMPLIRYKRHQQYDIENYGLYD